MVSGKDLEELGFEKNKIREGVISYDLVCESETFIFDEHICSTRFNNITEVVKYMINEAHNRGYNRGRREIQNDIKAALDIKDSI